MGPHGEFDLWLCAGSSTAGRLSRPRLTRPRRWKSSATRPAESFAEGGQHADRQGAKNRSSAWGEPALRNSGYERARDQDALPIPSYIESRALSY